MPRPTRPRYVVLVRTPGLTTVHGPWNSLPLAQASCAAIKRNMPDAQALVRRIHPAAVRTVRTVHSGGSPT